MRRQTATVTALAVLALATFAGCTSEAERECRRNYIASQKSLTGRTPTAREARNACDRTHGASSYRGGGSGAGK